MNSSGSITAITEAGITWQDAQEVTETYVHLCCHPFNIFHLDSHCFHRFERLNVVMYEKTSRLQFVNEARKDIFYHKNRAMDKLPLG